MTSIYKIIGATLVFALGVSLTAHADVPLKIVTVDMTRLYEGYYKTEEAQATFEASLERAQRQGELMMEEGNALVEEYRQIIEQANNPALSEQARRRAERDAEEKMQRIREKEQEVQQFQINTQRSLEQRQRSHQQLIFDELTNVVVRIARERGASLVMDTSGPSMIGLPTALYADPEFDITEIVMDEINKDRPEAAARTGDTGSRQQR